MVCDPFGQVYAPRGERLRTLGLRHAKENHTARAAELGNSPNDPRVSSALTQKGQLRKSRIGGWRLIYTVDEESAIVTIVTIERRGQVYKRL